MAGQTTLRVENCPPNTTITLIHNEILNTDGTVHRYLANMVGTYICSGTGVEEYRTLFTYYGFRYVEVQGYPGIPGEEAVTAHFVHSAVPQSGEFSSSSDLLNKIQHATRYASWSNLMDIPTGPFILSSFFELFFPSLLHYITTLDPPSFSHPPTLLLSLSSLDCPQRERYGWLGDGQLR